MTKKEIRKSAHQSIFKNGLSHQECFDQLRDSNTSDLELLASEVSKIPSSGKTKRTAALRYTFIGFLVIIMLLRIMGIVVIGMEGDLDPKLLVILVLLGIFLPVYGIYGALTGRVEIYFFTGIFLIVSTVRSFARNAVELDSDTLIGLIPVAAAVILSFLIPSKLKTPFKKSLSPVEFDGKTVNRTEYIFEDTRISREDVLDSTI